MSSYQLEELPLGRIAPYAGAYRDKSSDIDIVPTDGVLKKFKPNRTPAKALKEFFSLLVWHVLCELHFSNLQDVRISSPRPLALTERGEIFMTLESGVEAQSALSGGGRMHALRDLVKEEKQALRTSMAIAIGRLTAMKECESLVHGDFLLRHILCQFRPRALTVIDVENSARSVEGANTETNEIIEQIRTCIGSSRRIETHTLQAFDQGRSLFDPTAAPRLEDVLETARKRLELAKLPWK